MDTKISELHQYAIDQLATRKRQYAETPQSIIEHYNNELENINSYNGRQLLEMLQNADDAAGKPGCDKTVLIHLEDNVLTIANSGEPFSQGGLESILFSNLSPKVMDQNKIGQKGLGFRSVLSWAEAVTITSDGINLMFSRLVANEFLAEIIDEKPEIRDYISRKAKVEYPIAILRVPAISDYVAPLQGYDTIITIELREGVIEDVQSQIESIIDKETLIFLNNIEKIKISSPKRSEILSKSIRDEAIEVSIRDDNGNEKREIWHTNQTNGVHKDKNYELKVAWTNDLLASTNVIYSYFKTQQAFPFPGLVHGTFELTPDRNHLIDDPAGHNKFLLERLAELMVETAIKMTSLIEVSYEPLKLVNVQSEKLEGVFKQYDFNKLLINALGAAKILPTVNQKYISSNEIPIYYKEPIAGVLKGPDVDDLLQICPDASVESLLQKIGFYHYDVAEFSEIINKRLSEEASVLAILLKTFITTCKDELEKMQSNLQNIDPVFRDASGKPIPWNKKIFFPTEWEDELFKLPAEVAFLDPAIANALVQEFNLSSVAYLESKLKPFNFYQYSFEVFSAILKEAYLKDLTTENIKQFHQNLFLIWHKSDSDGEYIPKNSSYADLPAFNRNLEVRRLGSLYFGSSYGETLAEELFKHDSSKFLADTSSFGLKQTGEVRNYFEWLGAKIKPSHESIIVDSKHPDYTLFKNTFLAEHNYSEKIGQANYSTRQLASNNLIAFHVLGYEDLDNILKNCSSDAIFKWLKTDKSLKSKLEEKYDTSGSPKVGIKENNSPVTYPHMPNYLKWKFKSTAWMPSSIGKVPPTICCSSKTIGDFLSPLIVKPLHSSNYIAKLLELDVSSADSYLLAVGVHPDVSTLTTDQLYEMLLSLSSNKIEGKLAKYLYREILQNYDVNAIDIKNENYIRFTNYGYVWSSLGNDFGYKSVSSCTYLETKRYSDNIIADFNLIAVDRKQGNQQVRKLFGVPPLNNLSFSAIGKPVSHQLNPKFIQEIEHFKGIVYALRQAKDIKHTVLNQFKKLKIHLVSRLKGQYTYKNNIKTFTLNDYDFIQVEKGSTLTFYIQAPERQNSLDELRLKLQFSESIAEIFTTILRSEEHRSFIRELYTRKPSERDELFIHEVQTDGYQKLNRSRELLNLVTDKRANFWRAYFHATGIKVSDKVLVETGSLKQKIIQHTKLPKKGIEYFLEIENYNNLKQPQFLKNTLQLFTIAKIDISLFYERFEELDFNDVFYAKFRSLLSTYYQQFTMLMYQKYIGLDWQKKMSFFDLLYEYNMLHYDPPDGFQANIQSYFYRQIKIRFGISLQPVDRKLSWNLNAILKEKTLEFKEKNLGDPEGSGLTIFEIQSLLILDETIKLAELMKANSGTSSEINTKPSNLESKGLNTQSIESLSESMDKVYDYDELSVDDVEDTCPVEFAQKHVYDNSLGKGLKGYNFKNGTESNEDIGFIAERLVFEALSRLNGATNVTWKSENARKCGNNNLGVAGLGYDLEYTFKGELKYVEVKCISSTEFGFILTDKEMRVAMHDPSSYEIFTVEQINNKKPKITRYADLFVFVDEETLFKNNRFALQSDSYKIRFTNVRSTSI